MTRAWCSRHIWIPVIVGVLAFHGVGLYWNAQRHSPALLEPAHLISAIYYSETGCAGLYAVNPPLIRLVSAVPFSNKRFDYDWRGVRLSPIRRPAHVVANRVFSQGDDIRPLLFRSRMVLGAFTIFFAAVAVVVTTKEMGRHAGACFFVLVAFCPCFLAHETILSNDLFSAYIAIVATCVFSRWLKSRSWGLLLASGFLLGLAVLSKFTLLILYPVLTIVWCINRGSSYPVARPNETCRGPIALCLLFAFSLLVINCGYSFEGSFTPLREFTFHTTMFTGCDSLDNVPPGGGNRFNGSGSAIDTALGHIPMPFPASMLQGIDAQRYDFERGEASYLRGEHSDHGWWYYYLYALLVKMPLGTWGLTFLAIGCSLFAKGYNASWRDEMTIALPGLAIFILVSSQTGFSVHSRYIIPALPFLFVWISKVGRAFTKEVRALNPRSTIWVRGMVVCFLAWMIASSLWVYPCSLSYFNELAAVLPTPYDTEYPTPRASSDANEKTVWQKVKYVLNAGPRNGPRHLLDSNIDWGQDLYRLEDWCKKHPEARPLRVAYWGSRSVEVSGIEPAEPLPLKPTPGWYALSVNEIYGRSRRYQYFLNFEPVDMAGYSIYIYEITLEDANRVRRELKLPALPAGAYLATW